jgi:ketosteroid isomerase-like protein
MSESNVAAARRGYEAAAHGDFGVIAALLDPGVKWHGGNPAAEGACQNRDQALRFMQRARRGRLGELVDVVDAGERVVVIMRPRPEGDEPATLVANLTTFRDGKVIEMVHYPSPEDALAAARAYEQPG